MRIGLSRNWCEMSMVIFMLFGAFFYGKSPCFGDGFHLIPISGEVPNRRLAAAGDFYSVGRSV